MATVYIGMDVHVSFTQVAAINGQGKLLYAGRCDTTISELRTVLDEFQGAKRLTFEEGALAGWLYRNLRGQVDELIVCEPRRNALIAKESDKDDPIDARKLAELYRGGFLKPVHQTSDERAAFKDHVSFYHYQKRKRVALSCSILARLHRYGVFARQTDLDNLERRTELLTQLPRQRFLQADLDTVLEVYDQMRSNLQRLTRSVTSLANRDPDARRLQSLPGVGPIRAATLVAYLDTPYRFRTKTQLWRYLGIGLMRRHSGRAKPQVCVFKQSNRRLKDAIIGAAETVIKDQTEPFYARFQRWCDNDLSRRNARRSLARALAVTAWGMWKSQTDFDPDRWTLEAS